MPCFGELGLEGGGDRDAVEDGVDRDAGEPLLLAERDAELLVGRAAAPDRPRRGSSSFFALLRRRVVDDRLVVDRRVTRPSPSRVRLGSAISSQRAVAPSAATSSSHSGSFFLLEISRMTSSFRPGRHRFGLDVGDEAVLVLALGELLEGRVLRFRHARLPPSGRRAQRAGRASRPRARCGRCG